VLNNIHLSAPIRKIGEKIVKGLAIGSDLGGIYSYLGGKEIYKDVKSLLPNKGSGSNLGGSNNNTGGKTEENYNEKI
jgi:hypothetical protein